MGRDVSDMQGLIARRTLLLAAVCSLAGAGPAGAQERGLRPRPNRAAGETPSGLPVPRFVSLKYRETNARSGPDISYPVRWVYRRRGLPVRVIAETDDWRRIEDPDGSVCWLHKRTLDGRRTAITRPPPAGFAALRARPQTEARILANLTDGVIGEITDTAPGWRELQVGARTGWIAAGDLWGA